MGSLAYMAMGTYICNNSYKPDKFYKFLLILLLIALIVQLHRVKRLQARLNVMIFMGNFEEDIGLLIPVSSAYTICNSECWRIRFWKLQEVLCSWFWHYIITD